MGWLGLVSEPCVDRIRLWIEYWLGVPAVLKFVANCHLTISWSSFVPVSELI